MVEIEKCDVVKIMGGDLEIKSTLDKIQLKFMDRAQNVLSFFFTEKLNGEWTIIHSRVAESRRKKGIGAMMLKKIEDCIKNNMTEDCVDDASDLNVSIYTDDTVVKAWLEGNGFSVVDVLAKNRIKLLKVIGS